MIDKLNRKLAAIMFADIVSYSRLMGSNEGEALKLLKDFESISAKIVEEFDGIIIKKNGDQIFCEFSSAKHAVDASIKIQNELAKYNDSRPKDFKLEIRIGIHIGDVVKREDGDIHGDGVNVAARIQPLASPGGICVSGAVSDAISSHPDYDVISKGEQELKNILQKHSIFQVKTGHETIEPQGSKSIYDKSRSNYALFIVAALVITIGLIFYNQKSNEVESHLSIMLTTISSVEDLKKLVIYIYELVEYAEIPDDIKLELLSKTDLDEIYDEFLSYTEKHKFAEKMLVKNSYYIEEKYKRKGMPIPEFNFVAVKGMLESLFGISEDDFYKNAIGSLWQDSLSIGSYNANISETDFGYFPVIFRFNSSEYRHYNEYLIWNALVYNKGGNWSVRGEASISSEKNIVQTMHSALNYKVNTLLATNHGMITSINDKEVLIKFDPQNSRPLKERMMYDVKRKYTFP